MRTPINRKKSGKDKESFQQNIEERIDNLMEGLDSQQGEDAVEQNAQEKIDKMKEGLSQQRKMLERLRNMG